MTPELPADFYSRPVGQVARDLIGCTLLVDGVGGEIVETESYHQDEAACHAHVGVTARNHTLFAPPGRAYVYLSYGIHRLLNLVCEPEGVGAAVLIRALAPTRGVARMRERRGLADVEQLCSGPGKLTQALGVTLDDDGAPLHGRRLAVLDRPAEASQPPIVTGPRIGITKAAELPWRFCAAGSRHVSRPWPSGHAARRAA